MNELALFAGAGGGILGGKLLGWRTVCAVEIDPYCRQVLLARQADGCLEPFPIWDDVKTFDGRIWRGYVDVVSGGFPCQDISCAGTGKGIEGERSGLWTEFARIVSEVQPGFVWVENSPMLTSRGLGRVLGDLAVLGYDAQWGIVSAYDAGAVHLRARIWIIAHAMRLRLQGGGTHDTKPADRSGAREQLAGLLESEAQLAISAGKDKRMSDGITSRMDRLKAIGNGQVPAVVKLAWETLKP